MFQQRPSMHARDSSGRQVSLLNDEPSRSNRVQFRNPDYSGYESSSMVRTTSNNSVASNASSPGTPGLMRADSYDSQNASDTHSPITPTYIGDFGRHSSYTSPVAYKEHPHYEHYDPMAYSYSQHPQYTMPMRSSYPDSRHPSFAESHVYEEDQYLNGKGGKRYPCRFKESHGCDRTFTTSGHASRHSKIHTAEKAVNCSHPGCQKKFTRADNMKQHLETHYKERSRLTVAQKSAASKSVLTIPAGIKKQSIPTNGRSSRASNGAEVQPELPPMVDPALLDPQYATAGSSLSYGPLNMDGIQEALVSQPMAALANGLDALAAAAADYQQSQA